MLQDKTRRQKLELTLTKQGAWTQLDRIKELCNTSVFHKWLRHLDAKAGSVLTAVDFVNSVQNCLCAGMSTTTHQFRLSGEQLDAQLELSETCCSAEAPRGRNKVVRAIANGQLADPTVTIDPRGLTSLI